VAKARFGAGKVALPTGDHGSAIFKNLSSAQGRQ
jgi:hypothetical protein